MPPPVVHTAALSDTLRIFLQTWPCSLPQSSGTLLPPSQGWNSSRHLFSLVGYLPPHPCPLLTSGPSVVIRLFGQFPTFQRGLPQSYVLHTLQSGNIFSCHDAYWGTTAASTWWLENCGSFLYIDSSLPTWILMNLSGLPSHYDGVSTFRNCLMFWIIFSSASWLLSL